MRTKLTLLSLSLVFCGTQVSAEPLGIISEIRGGVSEHDVRFIAADTVENGVDLNAEVLFVSPAFLKPLFSPRPHIGVQVNTDDGTSQVYAGATWTLDLNDRLWLGFSGGGALHNGETNDFRRDRKALGSRALFRLAGEAGVNLTEQFSLSLYYDHESNAFLADRNPGIDNIGVRAGWRF